MSYRTIVITSACKLSYKDNYLQILADKINFIHLSEINSLIIENTQTTITSVLLCELAKHKIKVIFCDEKHDPYAEIINYYSNYNSSKTIKKQIKWDDSIKIDVADQIIKAKINNQALLLKKYGFNNAALIIFDCLNDYKRGDVNNKEALAAKIYFNTLFGNRFVRKDDISINSKLNYGYTILLSAINRLIVNYGYLTQLGIFHDNQFNQFNLSCDIIETFRCLVDDFVLKNLDAEFDTDFKHRIIELFELSVMFDSKKYFLNNALAISVKSVINALNLKDVNQLKLYKYEL